jgi:hypothetical protein
MGRFLAQPDEIFIELTPTIFVLYRSYKDFKSGELVLVISAEAIMFSAIFPILGTPPWR